MMTYFENWYVPSVARNPRRKPPCEKTLNLRRCAIHWWQRLMGTEAQPLGPNLDEITTSHLAEFKSLLETAMYQRTEGGPQKPLAPITQSRFLEEIHILLKSAGPRNAGMTRAAVLQDPPAIYLEPVTTFPKETWTFEDATRIYRAAKRAIPNRSWTGSKFQYRKLASATLAIWFYTGHRATTYRLLKWRNLKQSTDGRWFLEVEASVKTGKPDRILVHPRLLNDLNACRDLDPDWMLPWPIQYRAVYDNHLAWQRSGGTDAIFSPQAWRRLHANMIAQAGYQQARQLTAATLGHSSAAITESNYCAIRDHAILSLPGGKGCFSFDHVRHDQSGLY